MAVAAFAATSFVITGLVRRTRRLGEAAALKYRLQVIIDAIPAVVWSNSPDGSAGFLNQRFRDCTGLSLEEGRGGLDECTARRPRNGRRASDARGWRAVREGSASAAGRRRISPVSVALCPAPQRDQRDDARSHRADAQRIAQQRDLAADTGGGRPAANSRRSDSASTSDTQPDPQRCRSDERIERDDARATNQNRAKMDRAACPSP